MELKDHRDEVIEKNYTCGGMKILRIHLMEGGYHEMPAMQSANETKHS